MGKSLKEQISKNSWLANSLICLTIVTALLIAYSNTFYSPFYFDDYGYVIGNSFVEITSLSFDNLKDAALKSPGKMRAIANISFALNHFFGGKQVFGFHLINFLIHAGASIAAYFLFVKTLTLTPNTGAITNRKEIAFFSALLWAVNPLHTNSITYIIQRMNSMAGLFFLASVLFYAHGRTSSTKSRQYSWFSGAFLSGIMAIFSKENALLLPVIICGYEMIFISKWKSKKDLVKILPLVAGAGLLIAGIALSLKGGSLLNLFSGYAGKDFTMLERLLSEPRVIMFYLSLLALPLPSRLNLLHDFTVSSSIISPPQTLAAIACIAALLYLMVWSYQRNRIFSFALFWFFGNLLIESTFLPLALIFEHRTYIPSLFLPLSLLVFWQQLSMNMQAKRLIVTLLIALSTLFTWQRNQVWTTTLSLWSDVATKSPNLSRGHIGKYFALKSRGEYSKAHQSLLEAFKVDPSDDRAMTNLVMTYMEQNKFGASIQVLNKFLATKQTAQAYIERAKAYAMLKRFKQTAQDADNALKIAPNNGLAWLIKGKALSTLNKRKEALEALTTAQNLGIDSPGVHEALGEVYINSGKIDLAIHYFKEAIKRNPDSSSSHYFLGLAYGKKGMRAEAKKEMEIGLYLRDNPKQIKNNPHNF